MNRHVDPEEVLAELKDFQRRTARWAFHRMFEAADASSRFLVADEVGLGKTLVAKGVIAQTIDHLQAIGDTRHDIVYICSNGAIAQQNLRKLLPRGIEAVEQVERLTMLPTIDLERSGNASTSVNLLAITPGTSLKFGLATGRFEERCLAYEFLRQLWGEPLYSSAARRIFTGRVTANEPERQLVAQAQQYRRAVRASLAEFAEEITAVDARRRNDCEVSLRELFEELTIGLRRKKSVPHELGKLHRTFIAEVRRAMAIVGVRRLQPDLIILDEFQRFKELLEPGQHDFGSELAHRLFNHVDEHSGRMTRTLLLSATPYRLYSTSEELDVDHYEDFLATCRFLFDDEEEVGRLRSDFTDLRRVLLSRDALHDASEICGRIGERLRAVMARTERLASTPDRDGMLTEVSTALSVGSDDIDAYLRIGDLTEKIHHHEPAEYWKSAPYLVNFMDRYKLKTQLEVFGEAGRLPELAEPGPGLLDWDAVARYGAINPQNARLRWLIDDLRRHRAFELLWIPASLPYYSTGSVYESPEARAFTKRLIFSGWAVVPKVVASLVSYEAERVAFQHRDHEYSADYRQRGGRRLAFRMVERTSEETRPGEAATERRAGAMTVFALTWPSPTLARLGDPRRATAGTQSVEELLARVSSSIAAALEPLVAGATDHGPIDQRWYWAAPLLLDHRDVGGAIGELLGDQGAWYWEGDSAGDGLRGHVQEAAAMVAAGVSALGRPPENLVEVLSEFAVGGPTVCALRAICAATGMELNDWNAVANAAWIGADFRGFFNSPEVTGLISQIDEESEAAEHSTGYWRSVLRHCIDGNLQAVLDEHLHVVRDWRGHLNLTDHESRAEAACDIAETVCGALGVTTSNFDVDIPRRLPGSSRVQFESHRMRNRFAVAYGQQRLDDGGTARIGAVATAFNSPFWPFVLASTSVGQEGLDFHLWCHSVVHWNLPSNPVDLEQREGRVHRFKGHAVRRNIALDLGHSVDVLSPGDVWSRLFAAAEASSDGDDMVPYWVYPLGPYKIERHVPVLPFSRDAAQLPKLRAALATYRLALGQPRQQELMEFLRRESDPSDLLELIRDVRVDLSPPELPDAAAGSGGKQG